MIDRELGQKEFVKSGKHLCRICKKIEICKEEYCGFSTTDNTHYECLAKEIGHSGVLETEEVKKVLKRFPNLKIRQSIIDGIQVDQIEIAIDNNLIYCMECDNSIQGCNKKPYRVHYEDGKLVGYLCPSCHKGR